MLIGALGAFSSVIWLFCCTSCTLLTEETKFIEVNTAAAGVTLRATGTGSGARSGESTGCLMRPMNSLICVCTLTALSDFAIAASAGEVASRAASDVVIIIWRMRCMSTCMWAKPKSVMSSARSTRLRR
ncbi:hypothetical protein FQZ97_749020 [compost metagenome]